MKIRAFTKYGQQAASTRQRLLQYLPYLEANGFQVAYSPLLDDDYVKSLATGEGYSKARIAGAYAARLADLLRGTDADVIWIYAELFPYLPSTFERLAFRSGKPVVYDFDDAFFHQYDDSSNRLFRQVLKGKLRPLLEGAAACTCGNEYLRGYAAALCTRSLIFPTVVDTEAYRQGDLQPRDGPPVIGWIGSPSTWRYVRPFLPLLQQFASSGLASIRAVGAGVAAAADEFPGLELVDWHEATEITEVQRMDIGIMPVPDEPWARGKSGYKLIQYGACALPVVASPVGVNSEIVRHGMNGFLASTREEWSQALSRLITDSGLRERMGNLGRQRVEAHYSLRVHGPRLVQVLEDVAREGSQSAVCGTAS